MNLTLNEGEVMSEICLQYADRLGWPDSTYQNVLDRLYTHYRVGLQKWLDKVWVDKAPADVLALLVMRSPQGPEHLQLLGYGFGVISISNHDDITGINHVAFKGETIIGEWTFFIKGFRSVNQEAKKEINGEVSDSVLPKPSSEIAHDLSQVPTQKIHVNEPGLILPNEVTGEGETPGGSDNVNDGGLSIILPIVGVSGIQGTT